MISGRYSALWIVCAVLLNACSGPLQQVEEDSPPLRIIAEQDVKELTPRADPIVMTGNQSPYWVNGVKYEVMASAANYREAGIASWYGQKFHGKATSNGEIFDVYAVSAAHRSLPIPSYVRVNNLENQRSLVVRVNDRGPFHPDRIIDLSHAAAVKLGFVDSGTSRVEVEYLQVEGVEDRRHPEFGGNGAHFLQVGAFQSRQAADQLMLKMEKLTTEPVQVSRFEQRGGVFYRVRVGPTAEEATLKSLQKTLASQGFGYSKILIE